MDALIDYGDGIYAVDAGYARPQLVAIHLIVDSGRVAVIDSGTMASMARVEQALSALGLTTEDVDYVVLTHVHLDHAAGAGLLMRRCTNARLVVHPRGVRHMAAPDALWAAVCDVYGGERARALYGELVPVPAERIVAAVDGARLALGTRELELIETPGHARHHICIRDGATGGVFTGDVFGFAYPDFDEPAGPDAADAEDGGVRRFIFPTTSPSQFDPVGMQRSIDRLLARQPPVLYQTHFGRIRPRLPVVARLCRLIDAHVAIALAERHRGAAREARIRAGLTQLLLDELHAFGSQLPEQQALALMAVDLDLNAQGLVCWLDALAEHAETAVAH